MNLVNVKEYLLNEFSNLPLDEVCQAFILFMENNKWFSASPQVIEKNGVAELYIPQTSLQLIHEKFTYYIENRNLDTSDKNDLLFDRFHDLFPHTKAKFKYFCDSNTIDEIDIYYSLDFLLFNLKKDLALYTNTDMDALVETICDELTIKSGNVLIEFFKWYKKNVKVKYTKDFILNSRQSDKTKQAYDCDLYLSLIYYLFNDEYINSKNLYYKAAINQNTADTWLYLSLHCICALRDSDLFRLPHPRLHETPEIILDKIKNGTFSDAEARLIVNNILLHLKHLPMKPSKTSRFNNVSHIKLFFPESTQVHFGILLAIVECHLQLSNDIDRPLIRAVRGYQSISKYLGDEIGELFLESDFSCRSADKTYMQIIELYADNIPSNNGMSSAKGYMLAALARSHKGSIDSFSRTTVNYLKDANFSGYSAEFIAKELFERGVCSFIPSMLLKIVTNNEYQKLDISNQTLLIKELGMSPLAVDNFITQIDTSFNSAKGIVNHILSTVVENRTQTILEILHKIAAGIAVSKQDDSMCLLMAMNSRCIYKDRIHCIGCKYEISTKATLNILANEFNRLLHLRDNTDKPYLKDKYTGLLKDTIAPIMEEIFICVKDIYGESAINELEYILKESQYD